MTNLKQQFIRLGEQRPDLRDHLRPILDVVMSSRRDIPMPKRDPDHTPDRGSHPVSIDKDLARKISDFLHRHFTAASTSVEDSDYKEFTATGPGNILIALTKDEIIATDKEKREDLGRVPATKDGLDKIKRNIVRHFQL